MSLRYLPNAISIARMLLVIPVIAWMLAGDYEAAWWLFLFAGLTDGVDGFFARRFGWQTELGALLDRNEGNITRSAQEAGLTRYHLRELLKRHVADLYPRTGETA